MKKFIAVILSVLMIFSAASVLAFAEGEPATYTVTFVNYDDEVIATFTVAEGENVTVPANPTRPSTEDTDYIFNGWISSVDNEVYYQYTIPAVTSDVTYRASYLFDEDEPNPDAISLFNLFANLFAQLNVIFEQIALFFEGLNNSLGSLFGG